MILKVSKLLVLGVLVSLFLPFTGCKPEQAEAPPAVVIENLDLTGLWKVTEAYKSKKLTKLLDNGFFDFDKEGKMSTNILGNPAKYPYTLAGNKITIDGAPLLSKFIVSDKTNDTLVLTTRLKNFDFKFITVKSKPE